MSETAQNPILAELKAMRKQLVTIGNLVHGLYRRSKGAPTQPPIPGLVADDTPMPRAGEIARENADKLRDGQPAAGSLITLPPRNR